MTAPADSGLNGRNVVVTGVAGGIGKAVVAGLRQAGATVWGLDRHPLPADADHVFSCDVSDRERVSQVCGEVSERCGGVVHGLVNTAGILGSGQFLDLEPELWRRVLDVNLLGCYWTIQALAPALTRAEPGRVVNVASMAGKMPGPWSAPYHASKAAVISLTRSAAAALAPAIAVNSVSPGVIDTRMWDRLADELREVGAEVSFDRRIAETPAGRAGTPEDVARAVRHLIGPESDFITGEDLNVNGGLVMY